MHEQLIIQTQAPWWLQTLTFLAPHWWGIAAVIISPMVGFAAAQRYRTHVNLKPSRFELATVSCVVTFVLSFFMWWKGYRDAEGALIIAVVMGLAYPIAFTLLMGVLKKWWPWAYENLQGRSYREKPSVIINSDDNNDDDDKQDKTKTKTFFTRW